MPMNLKSKKEFERKVRHAVSFIKFAGDQTRMKALISTVGVKPLDDDAATIVALESAGLRGEVVVVVDPSGVRITETFVLIENATGDVIAITELMTLDELLNFYFNRN